MFRLLLSSTVVVTALLTVPLAQMRVVPLDEEQGHVALGLALRHLGNAGIFMHTTAHPDDENNGLLVMLNRGQGYRTALATATRGNGGQNEIGPEIFEALGVLRTQELAAMHRFDGAEQYFTRAVDFGYSFSLEETFDKWGLDEITADYVRLIRMIRPDVIVTLPPTGNAGGQHHMASAIITRDAYTLAGDPTKYPGQIKEGLRPWQPKKLYQSAGFGFPGEPQTPGRLTRINSDIYDALLGKTYNEIGTEARSMHKCQGMGQLLALPAPAAQSTYRLVETTLPAQLQKDETSLFDGVDSSLPGLAKYAGARVPRDLTEGLSVISSAVQAAQKNFDTVNDQATLKPLLDGLYAVRVLRRELRSMAIEDAAKYEIDLRLRQKEGEFQQAASLAHGVKIEALADDGVVVPGQTVKVNVIVANRGTGASEVAIKQVKFYGFDDPSTLREPQGRPDQGRGATGSGQAPSTSSGQAPSTSSGQGPVCSMVSFTGGGFGFPGAGRGRGPSTGSGRAGGGAAPPPQPMSAVRKGQVAHCEPTLTVPANTRITEPYWHRKGEEGRYTFDADAPFGLPFRPTPFYVQVTTAFPGPGNDVEIVTGLPIQHRYEDIFTGEKRTELLVVPSLSLRVTPRIAIVPAASIRSAPARPEGRALQTGRGQTGRGRASARPTPRAAAATGAPAPDREVRVTVLNEAPGATQAAVRLEAPPGWTATPIEQSVKFDRANQSQSVRFQVKPGVRAGPGEFRVRAVATANGQTFDRGYQPIEYPHVRRYHIYDAAETTLKVIDVRVQPNLTVGYIMGTGDEVPAAIEQLGVKVEMIDTDDLAFGNLSRFDAIVVGIRAYERRQDLRANNGRLLDYVFNGGTAIVQYNKFEFNDAQYGPYPVRVSSNRVTDEFSPVRVLAPRDRVFTTPNEINEAAWRNWVQERGLYFLGEKDARYRDLVQLEDKFTYNPGPKTGALVEATYGKGRWLYVGLGLWRQLPAGTDGAYQILANLISLGRAAR